jgi:hypothetical protein
MSLSASSRSHYLAVCTLSDQLDLNEYNWHRIWLLLEGQLLFPPENLHVLFDEINSNTEFSQIVSKFLMDRDQAGSLWVNLQMYVNLATQLLNILCDK